MRKKGLYIIEQTKNKQRAIKLGELPIRRQNGSHIWDIINSLIAEFYNVRHKILASNYKIVISLE